jgi:hypothetical protein
VSDDGLISEAQRRRLFAVANEAGTSIEYVRSVVLDLTGQESTKAIPVERYDAVVAAVREGPAAAHREAGGEALFDMPPEKREDPQT